MTKWTDGVLCRDVYLAGDIVLFHGMSSRHIVLNADGIWINEGRKSWPGCPASFWTAREWHRTYSLKPPRKGKKFEAQVQL